MRWMRSPRHLPQPLPQHLPQPGQAPTRHNGSSLASPHRERMYMLRPVVKLCCTLLLASGSVAFAQQYTISTVAGGAPPATPASAVNTSIGQPHKVAVSGSNLYFSSGNSVFKLDSGGTLTLSAGNSRAGFGGDGGPAVNAQLNSPQGIAL